jgi:hypothetical protein
MVGALTVLLVCASSQTTTATLPDTPQGQLVQQFIDAFNDDTLDAVVKVVQMNKSAEPLTGAKPEQQADTYKLLRERFAPLRIERIVSASETEIVIAALRKDKVERWWVFTFEPTRPARFASITVKPAQGGGTKVPPSPGRDESPALLMHIATAVASSWSRRAKPARSATH